jgi:hypothetical protein
MADELAIRVKLLYDEGAAPGAVAPGARAGRSVTNITPPNVVRDSTRNARYWSKYASDSLTDDYYGKVVGKFVKSGIRFGGAAAIGAGLSLFGAGSESGGALSKIGGASLAGLFASGGNPVAALTTGLVAAVAELRRVQTDHQEKIEQGQRLIRQLHENGVNFRKEEQAARAETRRLIAEAIEENREKIFRNLEEVVYQTRLGQVR